MRRVGSGSKSRLLARDCDSPHPFNDNNEARYETEDEKDGSDNPRMRPIVVSGFSSGAIVPASIAFRSALPMIHAGIPRGA